ncbi:MAG: winged helix-turn-helix transcriptional regulator [Deltaproteobacteria bacterium]|jgi:ArsR family transcriptional regulator|nr:winged helix-turn-helix transcriptional regulator [Deltaproteobacteria bacterium]
MRELVKVFKALSDKNRLRILKMLQHKKMCVCELSAALGITRPSVSRHLSLMKDAGLVSDERNGPWIDYSLCEEKINHYAPVIKSHLKGWINDDSKVKEDLKKIKSLNRENLCSKV